MIEIKPKIESMNPGDKLEQPSLLYGKSGVDILKGDQDILNLLLNKFADRLMLTAEPLKQKKFSIKRTLELLLVVLGAIAGGCLLGLWFIYTFGRLIF